MSLFCISCQRARTVFSRATCIPSSTGALFHNNFGSHKKNSTRSRHLFTQIPMSKLGLSYLNKSYGMISFSQKKLNKSAMSVFHNTDSTEQRLLSPALGFKAQFCTKPLNADVSEEVGMNQSKSDLGINVTSSTEQEKSLTAEEIRVLREIEEEERIILEKTEKEELRILQEMEEEERWVKEQQAKAAAGEELYLWEGTFDTPEKSKLTGSVSEGYVHFENQQRIIQDVIEEMWNPTVPLTQEEEETPYFPRGKTGIFDLGELVDLLRDEHAEEVVAISLPKEMDWADYMVIVTVLSDKHLNALAQFVRKRCKQKDLKSTDHLPFLEKSRKHTNWIALDLGNIILHIFLQESRDYYDLEMLWTVGPLFDDLTNAPDSEIVQLLNTIT